jgi:hypothetical protein
MSKHHIPKVDTGDDYDFLCGTHAFGATIGARDLCEPCVKKALEIVELLAEAHDVLTACAAPTPELKRIRAKLLARVDKSLGKRPVVHYASTEVP